MGREWTGEDGAPWDNASGDGGRFSWSVTPKVMISVRPPEVEIAPLRSGKDTVKLVYSKPIPYPLVTKLVKAIVKRLKAKSGSS